jgi:RNA polymerase sigma factor (sigma-70 family)
VRRLVEAWRVGTMNMQSETLALRRLARALTADEAAAADLVQDTWVAALRHPPDEDRPVRPWLSTVLRNRHGSLLRSRSREQARLEAAMPAEVSPSALQLQVTRQLVEEIAELSERDRDLIVLRYWEGLSTVECAAWRCAV